MIHFDLTEEQATLAAHWLAHHAGEVGTAEDPVVCVKRPDGLVLITTAGAAWVVGADAAFRHVEFDDGSVRSRKYRNGHLVRGDADEVLS